MSVLTDRTIGALRAEHDRLVGLAASATPDQLAAPSGAAEWTVAQVLSHLGSGSEIMLAGLRATLGEEPEPPEGFNRSVWARWDAASPEQQRDGFVEHGGAVVAALEALTADQRDSLHLPVGFLPAPLSVAGFAGLRLNEAANHGWDVAVAFAEDAMISDATAAVSLDLLRDEIAFVLGFAAKPDTLGRRVTVRVPGREEVLSLGESVRLGPGDGTDATATFDGPAESLLRLITGRLGPDRTPAVVQVTGDVSLDELRAVFPGF